MIVIQGYKKLSGFDIWTREGTEEKQIKQKILSCRTFITDFDGTAYPGNFLYDLAADFFKRKGNLKALNKLRELSGEKKLDFLDLTEDYARLIRGADFGEFTNAVPRLLKRCYPSFGLFIDIMKKRGVECFLCSLTADFVAERLNSNYGLQGHLSVRYNTKNKEGKRIIVGASRGDFFTASDFKLSCLARFPIREPLLFAGNSEDDLGLFHNAGVSIAVNPPVELLPAKTHSDAILLNEKDPWKDLAGWLGEEERTRPRARAGRRGPPNPVILLF